MAKFSYVVRTRNGRQEKGTVEASSQDDAIGILQNRDLTVISVKEQSTGPTQLGRKKGRFHNKVTKNDLVVFARSMAAMTEAGLPLLKALETVGDQIRSKILYTAISEMVQDIRSGSTLRDAVAKHDTIFSAFWISLIETGEASGQLTSALEQIGLHLEKSGEIQRKVVSALIYPAILLMVAFGAVLIFTLKIIPTFAELFQSFGAKLPWLTQQVIHVSDFMRGYFLLICVAMVGIVIAFRQVAKTDAGKWQLDKIKLQLPVFGPVFQGVAAEQFASNLGTLLKAGVPILHAMEIVISTCSNKVVGSILEHMRTGIREGRPIAEPLGQSDIFPPMVAQMLAVGEQTGKLPDMLGEVSKYYEEQVAVAVERMTGLLEPILMVGLGLIIGTLVLAMYLPVFQMSQIVR